MSEKKLSYSMIFLAIAVMSTVLGLVCILNPDSITRILVTLVGISLIAYGLIEIYQFFSIKMTSFLVLGIILIGLGLFCLVNPNAVLGLIGLVLGLFLICLGAFEVKKSFDLKKSGVRLWWLWLIFAGLVCLIGLSGLFNPASISGLFASLIGFGFLINGLSSIWLFLILKKRVWVFFWGRIWIWILAESFL